MTSTVQHVQPFTDEDQLRTETSYQQLEVEQQIASMLRAWQDLPHHQQSTKLYREQHMFYLLSGLKSLPPALISLDASRPWLVYWMLHGLSLMGLIDHLPEVIKSSCVSFLSKCASTHGGYGGGPSQEPHLAPTYAAVNALCSLGTAQALESIDRQAMYQFLTRVKTPEGAFCMHENGEADVRGTYTALAVAFMLNIQDQTLVEGTAQWIASCQTYEGGFGGEPGNEAHGGYTFCAVAALFLLNRTELIDIQALLRWSCARQMRLEGGFQGRTNKLVDGCYSFWVGALFPLIDLLLAKHNMYPYSIEKLLASSPSSSTSSSSSSSDSPSSANSESSTTASTSSLSAEQQETLRSLLTSLRGSRINGGWLYDTDALQRYLLVCCQCDKGGLLDKPGKSRDYYHSCYCLSGLSTAQHVYADVDERSAHALGGSKNMLKSTNPIFNIEDSKASHALSYFSSLAKLSS